ncbi:vitamin K epoxide reductase complex subunit 1-like protein 1 [Liolophura sinensis]|uniref:vitamin K epoxide reductase complex subunit 1-like protein 1 n=1 Tax=Liolophura sinensis TaxID=3198878 RepID=UPI0031580936
MMDMATLGYLMFSNFADKLVACIMGIVVSAYALNIELKQAKNPKYKAYCDINDKMSCTRVLCSEYGKGFGVVGLLVGKEHFLNMPNCLLGIVFYSLQIILACSSSGLAVTLAYYASILSCIGSVYSGYHPVFCAEGCLPGLYSHIHHQCGVCYILTTPCTLFHEKNVFMFHKDNCSFYQSSREGQWNVQNNSLSKGWD